MASATSSDGTGISASDKFEELTQHLPHLFTSEEMAAKCEGATKRSQRMLKNFQELRDITSFFEVKRSQVVAPGIKERNKGAFSRSDVPCIPIGWILGKYQGRRVEPQHLEQYISEHPPQNFYFIDALSKHYLEYHIDGRGDPVPGTTHGFQYLDLKQNPHNFVKFINAPLCAPLGQTRGKRTPLDQEQQLEQDLTLPNVAFVYEKVVDEVLVYASRIIHPSHELLGSYGSSTQAIVEDGSKSDNSSPLSQDSGEDEDFPAMASSSEQTDVCDPASRAQSEACLGCLELTTATRTIEAQQLQLQELQSLLAATQAENAASVAAAAEETARERQDLQKSVDAAVAAQTAAENRLKEVLHRQLEVTILSQASSAATTAASPTNDPKRAKLDESSAVAGMKRKLDELIDSADALASRRQSELNECRRQLEMNEYRRQYNELESQFLAQRQRLDKVTELAAHFQSELTQCRRKYQDKELQFSKQKQRLDKETALSTRRQLELNDYRRQYSVVELQLDKISKLAAHRQSELNECRRQNQNLESQRHDVDAERTRADTFESLARTSAEAHRNCDADKQALLVRTRNAEIRQLDLEHCVMAHTRLLQQSCAINEMEQASKQQQQSSQHRPIQAATAQATQRQATIAPVLPLSSFASQPRITPTAAASADACRIPVPKRREQRLPVATQVEINSLPPPPPPASHHSQQTTPRVKIENVDGV